MVKPFEEGDVVLVIDARGHEYMLTLHSGGRFQSHRGFVPHEDIIGGLPGLRVLSNTKQKFVVLRPTLAEYVMFMPRSSTIIYPKDTGSILVFGDIFPGATVVEAGIGAGALTLSLLRAVGSKGRVISYERREDLAREAMSNIRKLLGAPSNHKLHIGSVYDGVMETEVDRFILDVPEPWSAVEVAARSLSLGGIFLAFSPTVLQVHRLCEELDRHAEFDLRHTFELLMRPWHFSGVSARPEHRMIAHSGFITRAVRCEPGKEPKKLRGAKKIP